MVDERYRKLAEHLNQLPGGFASSETGAEFRLLSRLFTPAEADLATHLTLEREEAHVIAGRAGLPVAEAERKLNEMSRKGLIFSVHPAEGSSLYQAAPWVIGIFEFQVNNLSEGLLQDLEAYWTTQKPRKRPKTIPQMRTIPIGESIEPHLEALPYERVNDLIQDHERYAVAPCICRRTAKMAGGGCDAPEETCLMFDEWADFYVRDGRGRYIELSDVREILASADAANLVLQPTNSRDIAAICCCCGCCCGILGGLKHHPKPAEAAASVFISQLDADLCDGCWDCLERCQMQALSENGSHVTLNVDRCIGCGLCVSTCPSDALTLVRKPESYLTEVPETMDTTWRIISEAQAEMRSP